METHSTEYRGRTSYTIPAMEAFERRVTIRAPRERVYDALTTLDGVRGWWSTDVAGTPRVGDVLRFGFTHRTHDEWIVMRVDDSVAPQLVQWSCVAQFVRIRGVEQHDEWVGTHVVFELSAPTPNSCELTFRHLGLSPSLGCYDVCAPGWEYFLQSLTAYVETGTGNPFGV